MYHYRESGLDNVYLENGYHVLKTRYGQGISIDNTEGLHKAIGRWLISLPKPLNGAEFRFLRLEMEVTQRHLASIIGGTEQTLRLWEKHRNKAISSGPADRLMRALYADYIEGDGEVGRRLERLAKLDQLEHAEGCFRETNKHWKQRTAPCLEAEILEAEIA